MIDIHTHILNGVDDGVKEIDESIQILKKMSKNGVTDIVLTPHYIQYSRYTSNYNLNIIKFNEIKKRIKEEGIRIKIYLGNEIYINNELINLLKNKEITSLGDSEYLLIELPIDGNYPGFMDIFYDLKELGYKIVLAHPERYSYFQDHIDELLELRNNGILFQVNLESILGRYGNRAKKTIKKLLKYKAIDFVGSDIHHDKSSYDFIEKAKNKFRKYLNVEEIELIFNENAKKILVR